MIKQVSHTAADTDPAGFVLALEVAYELHAPVTARAPEVAAVAHGAGRRAGAARSRRRRARA
ncbi:hypothetical protein [Streptomyces resistomycificus]|uniref:Uncharacterized protein n=1 Tax=Streptomyces resistomycificus TaxID=67356 RepID=A0A0L8L4U9_9ACTN|nr:hypothetical protein [Streptomyces resistomycificus]KOG33140.1 hypothetical protein ADK37_24045 [Streptomyces resistomycificus]KUN96385.1 hypothetical protein AQJ84_18495 [Streptomyces resistomycificus]